MHFEDIREEFEYKHHLKREKTLREKGPNQRITKYGDPLYILADLARASDVPTKTIREWLMSGELAKFITIYVDRNGKRYYRFGAPQPYDDLLYDHYYDYHAVEYKKRNHPVKFGKNTRKV